MTTCIAVYAGSFDPVTRGHLEVIRRAARLFDHVRVVVAVNPDKAALFSLEERVAMLRGALSALVNVSVDGTEGLVAEYAREIGASVLVRGFRDASDIEGETVLARLNESLAPELQSVLIPSPLGLCEVSSSAIKAKVKAGDDVSALVPREVARRLRERLASPAREDKEVASCP